MFFLKTFLLVPMLLFCNPSHEEFLQDYFKNDSNHELVMQDLNGGISTANLLIEKDNKKYVLRILSPKVSQKEQLKELYMMQETSKLAIAPRIHAISPQKNMVLLEYIDANTSTPNITKKHAKKAGEALKKAHSIPKNPYASNTKYLDQAERRFKIIEEKTNFPGPSDAIKIIRKYGPILEEMNCKKANIHADIHPRNVFLIDHDYKIIDWEDTLWDNYLFDLSGFVIFHGLDKKEEKEFLEGYFDRPLTSKEKHAYTLSKKINFALISLINFDITSRYIDGHANDLTLNKPLKSWYCYMQYFSSQNNEITIQFFYDTARSALEMSKNTTIQ